MRHPLNVVWIPPEPRRVPMRQSFRLPRHPRHLLLPGEATRYGDQALDEHRCFLCGRHLNKAPKRGKGKSVGSKSGQNSRTEEDVFPKWLLRMHGLDQSKLVLSNRTTLRYSQLRIPACQRCNGGGLSGLERRVGTAFDAGYEAVAGLNRYDLYLWLAKLCYGLLFRTHYLAKSRSAPDHGTIVDREAMHAHRVLLTLLQGLHRKVVPHAFPGTIRLWRTHVYEGPGDSYGSVNFNYWDNPVGPYIALRSRGVGITANLLDWGLIERVHWPMLDLARAAEPLTDFQFREVAAHGWLQTRMLKTVPTIEHWEDNGTTHVRPILHTSPPARLDPFREFDPKEWGALLAWTVRVPEDFVYQNGAVCSWLANPDGTPEWVADKDHVPSGVQRIQEP